MGMPLNTTLDDVTMRPRSASHGDIIPPTSQVFVIHGTGYMDRQRDESSPSKGNYWGDTSSPKRDGGDDVTHNNNKNKSEYINRLTSLRDSLINHEEASLAQALDRLRLHSLTSKSHSNKLRMRPTASDDFLSAPPLIHQRKNMVTTVERFRQIRPSRHQPVIFPLQGRQMLEMASPRPASEVPISNFGNSTNRSTRSQSEYMVPKPSYTKLDETVQANLQRLIQRTSSIPNIGRKALRNQDGLEPKTKPLLNIRASLQKAHGHLASPFLLNTHEDYDSDSSPNARSSADMGVENLSPQALKLSPVIQPGDTIDMDKLSQYYQKLISDMEMEGREGGDDKINGKGDNRENYENGVNENNNPNSKFFHYKVKYRHTPFKSSLAKGQQHLPPSWTYSEQGKKHYNSYNSIVSSSGKTIPLSELPNIAPRTTHAYPTDVITDDVIISDSNNNNNNNGNSKSHPHLYFPEVQTSYRLPNTEVDSASEISKWCGGKSVFREKSTTEDEFSVANNHNNNNNSAKLSKDGRVKIVVDMPNIIFNAASPENEGGGGLTLDGIENTQTQGQGQQQHQSAMSLKKTVKQHELRQKELQNLLEDVKELNSWSEVAAKKAITEGS